MSAFISGNKRWTYLGHEYFPGEYIVPQNARNDRVIFVQDSRYVQSVSERVKGFKCDRCDREFHNQTYLDAHQRASYTIEQLGPEKVKEIRKRNETATVKALKEETLTDLAERAGLGVTTDAMTNVPVITR